MEDACAMRIMYVEARQCRSKLQYSRTRVTSASSSSLRQDPAMTGSCVAVLYNGPAMTSPSLQNSEANRLCAARHETREIDENSDFE